VSLWVEKVSSLPARAVNGLCGRAPCQRALADRRAAPPSRHWVLTGVARVPEPGPPPIGRRRSP